MKDDISLLQIIILAIVQGITEFLPISSSAHLILVPAFAGWTDQGLALDVAMHIGSLLAVLIYFRHDVAEMAGGAFALLAGRPTAASRLALQIVMATLPVVVAGFIFKHEIETEWRSAELIMMTTAIFGILLWVADRKGANAEGMLPGLSWRDAALIGLAQALALVPGVSRSGITMTAALLLGQNRPEAARFSLLLSIPTTAAAGALGTYDLVTSGTSAMQSEALLGGGLAFASAWLSIAGLMAWLKHSSFTPFVIYRLALAAIIAIALVTGFI